MVVGYGAQHDSFSATCHHADLYRTGRMTSIMTPSLLSMIVCSALSVMDRYHHISVFGGQQHLPPLQSISVDLIALPHIHSSLFLPGAFLLRSSPSSRPSCHRVANRAPPQHGECGNIVRISTLAPSLRGNILALAPRNTSTACYHTSYAVTVPPPLLPLLLLQPLLPLLLVLPHNHHSTRYQAEHDSAACFHSLLLLLSLAAHWRCGAALCGLDRCSAWCRA